MRRPSVVLWDVGGTLVDYAMSSEEFLRRSMAPTGIGFESLRSEDVLAAEHTRLRLEAGWRTIEDERMGYVEVASVLLRGADPNNEIAGRVAAAIGDYFDVYAPVRGIHVLLDDIREAGFTQGVVSNWPPSLRRFLAHHDLEGYFKVVVGSGEEGVAKPDTLIFERALEALDVRADQCVYIGDTPEKDIAPAQKLGMRTIHFDPRGNYAPADERDIVGLRGALSRLMGI